MSDRWNPIKYRLSRVGFSVRQFLTMFLIASIILFLVQLYTFRLQMEENRTNTSLKVSASLDQANVFIDYYVSSMQELLRTSVMREDLFDHGSNTDRLLDEISSGRTGVQHVYAIQEDGALLCGNQLFYEILGNENVQRQMEFAATHPNEMIWSQPYYSKMQAGNAMCVAYMDGQTGNTIAAEVNLRVLYRSLSQFLRNSGQSFIITTKEKEVIVFDESVGSLVMTVHGKYPVEISRNFDELLETENGKHTFFTFDGIADRHFMQSNRNIIGWYITAVVNDEVMNQGVAELWISFGISFIFGMSMICIAVFIVVFFFTKPLRQLAFTMENAKDLDTLKTIDNKRVDEVGRLTECYNRLVLRIQKLVADITEVERKKSVYEFRMHQSQIGPHFLRNTLYCIASLLRQKRLEDAEGAMKALAGLLSYSFDSSDPIVSLDQEINSLERYISIQKVRYGDTFEVDIQRKKNIRNCKVLKLILQPLVENAILHGLPAVMDGDGRIKIRIYRHGRQLVLLVADNGCGMSQEKAEDIVMVKQEEWKKDRYSNIGVANVQERIRLHYGDNYGLQVISRIGMGTIVRIRMPYQEI